MFHVPCSMKKLAKVKIIKPGYFKWIGKNKFRAASNITLIKDNGKNILVDTGSFGEEKKIIQGLKKESLKPEDIDIVVITHPHSDHIGNNHLFTKAAFINSLGVIKKNTFFLIRRERKITKNVKFLKTPGHALEDRSVLVNTEKGKVAVVGDLFWKAPGDKLIIVESRKKLRESRKKILKMADWVVPGHGEMFKV